MKKLVSILLTIAIVLCFSGCGHEHVWKEADCTTPKTCEECGETEGEPLGHTVKIGKCERCGELVNVELLNKLITLSKSIDKKTKYIGDESSSIGGNSFDETYRTFKEVEKVFPELKKELEEFVNLCADYEELKGIKQSAQNLCDSIPSVLKSSSPQALVAIIDEYVEFLEASSSNAEQWLAFLKSLQ